MTQEDLDVLRDQTAPNSDRDAARERLRSSNDARLFDQLVQLAQDPTIDEPFAEEVGALIGRILWRTKRVDETPLHNFTGPAYQAYDRTIAELERGRP